MWCFIEPHYSNFNHNQGYSFAITLELVINMFIFGKMPSFIELNCNYYIFNIPLDWNIDVEYCLKAT